jgi:hypothetical protein
MTNELLYDTDMACHKVVVPISRPDGNSLNITFPIFIDKEVPESYVFYDYYESGALYINIPTNVNIHSYKESFVTILSKYIYGDPSFVSLNFENPQEIASFNSNYSWTKFFFHPSKEGKFGFLFPLDLIFEIKNTQTSRPICKNFTLSEKDSSITEVISPNYAFANLIKDTTICSHPVVAPNDTFSNCSFGISNQHKCAFYEPLEHLIKSAKNYNSTTSNLDSHISLTYFRSYTHYVFVINNNITESEITRLSFPISSEYDLEELTKEAILIFDSIVETYPNMDISSSEPQNSYILSSPSSLSYISHLVGNFS